MSLTKKSERAFKSRRACLTLSFVVACAASVFGQSGRSVVVETAPFPNYPVELLAVDVSGESHAFVRSQSPYSAASFDAPEDWLHQLTFKIRNKSDQTIISAQITGSLAVGEAGEIPWGVEVRFGRELDESAFTGRAPRGVASQLAPGETAEVRWSEAEYDELAKMISTKHPVADYRRMRVEVREVRFEDSTVWSMGKLFRIDPNDPRKWTPLDKPTTSVAATPDLKPGERVIEVSDYKLDSDADVISISEIRIAGQTVTPGRPFFAGEDWLRSLTMRVKNISTKPITFLQFNFSLPDAHYHNGGLGFMLHFGRSSAGGTLSPSDVKQLAPGEEVELTFTDADYEMNRDFVQRRSGAGSLGRLRVGSVSVTFADGTRASALNPARARKPAAPAVPK